MTWDQNNLSLHPDHLADLKKSGLSETTIKASGIYSVRPADINRILGPFFSGKVSSVLAFPYSNHNGYQRYKLFPGVQTDNGTVKYYQPPKTGSALYIPPGVEAILGDINTPLYINEGEKKSLKAWQEGLPCIGIGGLWSWSDGTEEKKLISDFEKINFIGRTVYIVPDNDWKNPNSHGEPKNLVQAVHGLAHRLIDRGARVFIVELPPGPEKGLDDYLVSHFLEEFKKLPTKEIRGEEYVPTVGVETHLSDIGNSARLTKQAGNDLKYCKSLGWIIWDGKRYMPDESYQVMKFAKRTALSLFDEAKEAADDERRKAAAKHAVISQRRERLSALVDLTRCELAVSPNELDADRWLLNVLNGTVNLKTGELLPHKRENLITKICPVEYLPDATCPLWDKFLLKIMDGDESMISYLQTIAGICLTGDIREQILFIFHGQGSNGKNVFIDTLREMMGDYASEAPPDLLVMRKGEPHPTELADLCGRRLVTASEAEEGSKLRIQLIKRLTGDRTIKARKMRQDFFEFDRTHKMILATNHRPQIKESTHAIWRRIRLTPFNVIIPDEEQDKELTDKLRTDWPGILRWAIEGSLAWQRDGLAFPEEVQRATQTYQQEEDPLNEFIEERCLFNENAFTPRTNLFCEYEDWASGAGERNPLDRKAFYDRLRRRGITETSKKIGGKSIRIFTGIGLVTDEEKNS